MTKSIFALILLVIFSSFSVFSITKDIAIFRFEGKVVFVSDLNQNLSAIKAFRCFPFHSYLLEHTLLNKKAQTSMAQFEVNEVAFKTRLNVLNKIINLEKIIFFANKQAITIDDNSLSLFKSKKCLKDKFDKWPTDLQEMVRAEVYLRDRFVFGKKVKGDSLANFVNTIFSRTKHEMLILK